MASECYLSLIKNLRDLGVDKDKRDNLINSIDNYVKNKELSPKKLKQKIDKEVSDTIKSQTIANQHEQGVLQMFANKAENNKMKQAIKKDPITLIKSFIEGVTFSGTKDGEVSYMGTSSHFESKYKASFRRDLGELEDVFNSLDDNQTLSVYKAMSELKKKGGDISQFDPETIKIAKAVNNHFDLHRKTLYSMGVKIGDQSDNWFGPQIHDASQISTKSSDEWIDFLVTKLDKDKTLGKLNADETELRSYLEDVYNRIVNEDFSKMNGSRSFIFKDAESKFDYDKEFGYENLSDMVNQSVRKGSKTSALHFMLGKNPKEMFDKITETSLNMMPEKSRLGFKESDLYHAYKNVLFGNPKNSQLTEGETHFANFTNGYLKFQRLTKLQQSILNTLVDTVNIGGFYKAYLGDGQGGIFKGLNRFRESMMAVPSRGDAARELDTLLGVMQSDHFERFDPLSGPDTKIKDKTLRAIGRGVDKVTKLNGLLFQEQWAKRASVYTLANDLAEMANKGLKFDALPERTKSFLNSQGIRDKEFELISQFGRHDLDGRSFISIEKLENIPFNNPVLKEIAKENGVTALQARDMLSRKYGAMVNSWAQRTVVSGGISSSVKINSFIGNPRKDSYRASLAALVTQFKGYPLAATETIKRIVLSNPDLDATRFRDLLNKENAKHLTFLGDYVGTGIALSMASIWVKDVINNKTPRDISPEMMAEATAMAIAPISFGYAMDILTGEFKSSAMLGPWARDADDLAQLTHAWISGDETALGKTFNKLWQQVPLRRTIPFTFFMDDLYKSAVLDNVDPTYSKRLDRSRKKRLEDRGQEKIFE